LTDFDAGGDKVYRGSSREVIAALLHDAAVDQ
jgi:hypothetical protein